MSVVPSECSSPAYSSSKEVERTAETASSEAETEERDSGIRNILKTFEQFQPRIDLFPKEPAVESVSPKINQKVVAWMITICWKKGIAIETLLQTLLIYYAYKAQRHLVKDEIERLMLTCLALALKMTDVGRIRITDLLKLSARNITLEQMLLCEAEVLQALDYNVVIPNVIQLFYSQMQVEKAIKTRVLFMVQLFATQSQAVFFDTQTILHLIAIAESTVGVPEELLAEVARLLLLPFAQIIITKYSSKFDTDEFICRLGLFC